MSINNPEIISPTNGSIISHRLRVHGSGLSGATVELYEINSGAALFSGSAIVDRGGNWSLTNSPPFRTGDLRLQVVQKVNGVQIGKSGVVHCSTLEKPLIILPVNGSVVSDKLEVTGEGVPGAIIQLFEWGNADKPYGETKADSLGTWKAETSRPLPQGQFILTAIQQSGGGKSDFADPVALKVVGTPIISTPRIGAHVFPKPEVTGLGQPGEGITFYNANTGVLLPDSTSVQSDGSWSVEFLHALPVGYFSLMAKQSPSDMESNVVYFFVEQWVAEGTR